VTRGHWCNSVVQQWPRFTLFLENETDRYGRTRKVFYAHARVWSIIPVLVIAVIVVKAVAVAVVVAAAGIGIRHNKQSFLIMFLGEV
jgi:hypothetical protein